MKLQRPTLEDKDAILEMIAEFDAAKSYMHGGMGSTWKRAKDYEDCLKDCRAARGCCQPASRLGSCNQIFIL